MSNDAEKERQPGGEPTIIEEMVQREAEERSYLKANRRWLIVSYYTMGTEYREEARGLIESCEKFKLNYYVKGVANLGHWLANVRWRPVFMRRMLDKFPDFSIVWIDADGRVREDPVLFDELETADFDLAVHYRRGVELLGGTMWVRNSGRARELINLWEEKGEQNVYEKEQVNLQIVLRENPRFRVLDLPPKYCLIFDTMRAFGPPVIEHLQASRRLKKTISDQRERFVRRTYAHWMKRRMLRTSELKGAK
jgi:hypothetical protein